MRNKVRLAGIGRSTQSHYNKVLTNLSVEFTPPGLVARQLLPEFNVVNRSDVFPVFDKALFDVYDDVRTDGDEANEVSRGWKYDSYVLEKHALKDHVTNDQRKNWDSEVDLEAFTMEALKQWVWNRYEQRVFGSGGLVRTAANNTYNNAENWSNLATASPRTSVDNAIAAVEDAAGVTPNTIALAPKVMRHIIRTSEYREEAKYTLDIRGLGSAAIDIDGEMLPSTLYGMRVAYVRSMINTAKKGQAKAPANIMSDDVWLGYVNPTTGPKMMTYGLTIMGEEIADTWYEKARKADAYEYEANYQPKLIAKECGALLTDVLT